MVSVVAVSSRPDAWLHLDGYRFGAKSRVTTRCIRAGSGAGMNWSDWHHDALGAVALCRLLLLQLFENLNPRELGQVDILDPGKIIYKVEAWCE